MKEILLGARSADLLSEVDEVLKRSVRHRASSQSYVMSADQARTNTSYAIFTGAKNVTAEFLCQGRGAFCHMSFFRHQASGGKTFVYGIVNYSLVREVVHEYKERD